MDQVLIIVGDATETVDTLYPYYRFMEAGYPAGRRRAGETPLPDGMHEVKPGWTITKEWEGYTIEADDRLQPRSSRRSIWASSSPAAGRRNTFATTKTWCASRGTSSNRTSRSPASATAWRSRRRPAASRDAGWPRCRKCQFDLEVCGGMFVDEPCVIDGNLVSGRTFHDHGHYIGPWIKLLLAEREQRRGRSNISPIPSIRLDF